MHQLCAHTAPTCLQCHSSHRRTCPDFMKMLPKRQSSNFQSSIFQIFYFQDQDSREISPAGKDRWHLQSCTGAKVPEIEIWIWCQIEISKTKLIHSIASNTFSSSSNLVPDNEGRCLQRSSHHLVRVPGYRVNLGIQIRQFISCNYSAEVVPPCQILS